MGNPESQEQKTEIYIIKKRTGVSFLASFRCWVICLLYVGIFYPHSGEFA